MENIKLILVRHGQSLWNLENRFTGWTDIDLSENGIKEAHEAGKILKENNFTFDIAFTSVLVRATRTLDIILDEMNLKDIPVVKSWKLNERHYGALQGLNKGETALKYGDEQVRLWRRSVDVTPPKLDENDERNPKNDIRYQGVDVPLAENLLDTIKRVIDYYENEIKKELLNNKRVLIVAHGNSLRALMKYLDNISDQDIMNLEIETGRPICYELDKDLNPIKHYYL